MRFDFGAWTGAAFADLDGDPAWDRWNRARGTAAPPDGEPMAEAAGRVARLARALAGDRPGGAVALVTHADLIRALVATALGMPLDNLLRIEVAPASVTRIDAAPSPGRAQADGGRRCSPHARPPGDARVPPWHSVPL